MIGKNNCDWFYCFYFRQDKLHQSTQSPLTTNASLKTLSSSSLRTQTAQLCTIPREKFWSTWKKFWFLRPLSLNPLSIEKTMISFCFKELLTFAGFRKELLQTFWSNRFWSWFKTQTYVLNVLLKRVFTTSTTTPTWTQLIYQVSCQSSIETGKWQLWWRQSSLNSLLLRKLCLSKFTEKQDLIETEGFIFFFS